MEINSEDISEQTNNAENEVIIIKSEGENIKNIDVDASQMSFKALKEMDKKDLVSMCEERRLFTGLKAWEIKRLNKANLAKLLKDGAEVKEEVNEPNFTTQDEPQSNDLSAVDFTLLKKALNEFSKGEDTKSLDAFAMQVVENSDTEIINAQSVERFNKVIYYGSLTHLMVKNLLGGYTNAKNILKGLYGKLKGNQPPIKEEKKKDED